MKFLNKHIYGFFTCCLIALGCLFLNSCTDDLLYESDYVPKGDVQLDFVVEYLPLVERTETAGTRAVDGWANGTVAPYGEGKLTSVNKVTVLFYDAQKKLIRDYSGPVQFTANMKDRDVNATNIGEIAAETKTPEVTFSKKIESGKYYIYAVLNTDVNLNSVQTVDDLRSTRIDFITNDISKNLQMFGVFTSGDSEQAENMDFEEDKLLTLRPGSAVIHSWARRALAKVTIDFDGSELRNNVTVYIKSARIHTLASWNYLGKESKIESANDTVVSSHTLVYGEGSSANGGFRNWPSVSRGSGRLDSYTLTDGKKIKFHNEYAPSLVCFENRQGNGEKKFQDRDNDGKVDYPTSGTDTSHPFFRDGMKLGTYLEVQGYYEGNLSHGPITYRFMLGDNAVDNYDVTRNHHYKVTMKFRGNGNDVDWHVDYKEIPPKIYANDIYASYAYNEAVTIPVRVVGDYVTSIEAEIIENNWHPQTNVDNKTYFTNGESVGWSGKDANWKKSSFSYVQDGVKHKGYGFLSLYPSSQTTLSAPSGLADWDIQSYAEDYWLGKGSNGKIVNGSTHSSGSLGKRIYENGEFYEADGIKETIFNIEAYTREKNLVKTTGYSGQNFYETGNRIAKIALSVKVNVDGKTKTIKDTVTVTQARRVTNPTGVYRSWNNNKPFHVNLKAADKEPSASETNDGTYSSIKSDGPWRAVIDNIGNPEMISLSKYWGDHDSEIDFTINFNGQGSKDKSEFAIISIYYHNYTCHHKIFVRRGYAPVSVINNQCRWHVGNVSYRSNSELYDVSDPTDEGSLFRYGNLAFAISPLTNKTYGFNKAPGTGNLTGKEASGTSKKTWANITYPSHIGNIPSYSIVDALVAGSGNTPTSATERSKAESAAKKSLKTRKDAGKSYPATFDDFYRLYNGKNVEFAFGVIYGDDCTETATTFDQAFGHCTDDKKTTGYGMRGVIVYNVVHGRHVMFPIGSSGFGHRDGTGRLRYAGRDALMSNDLAESRAPFWNIMYSRGALYWLAAPLFDSSSYKANMEEDPIDANCWDMNYKTMDFNHYGVNAFSSSTAQAAFIRMVEAP